MLKRTALISTALIALTAFSFGIKELCSGIVEENDQWIPEQEAGVMVTTGIDRARYNEILDRIQEIYEPIFAEKGKRLVIRRQWWNGTVNAFAQQFFNRWIVTFPGGLPRHPAITADGFALVACHEIGHHVGGFPTYSNNMSVEGQADYFANSKCLKHYFTPRSNREYIANNDIDPFAAEVCRNHFTNENEWISCVRASMAGMSVSVLFQDLRKENRMPAFQTPDPEIVDRTNSAHPATQCRLDTYFQGSLCTQDINLPFSMNDEEGGACTANQGFEDGFRPLCWFAPATRLVTKN